MAVSTFNPGTGEGRAPNDGTGSDSFATIRGAASCSTATDDVLVILTSTSGSTFRIHRVFLPFDTSALPDNATVSAVTLQVYRSDAVATFANNDTTAIHVVTQTQASDTSLVQDDYDQVSFTSKGSKNFADTANDAYQEITIADTTVVSLTGFTKLALLTGRDQGNSQPTSTNVMGFQARGAANPPILTVTFSAPGFEETTYSFFL